MQDIIVYGHGDTSKYGFPSEEDLKLYLKGGIFRNESGRYRYSQQKRADIVVLSRKGFAYGHFIVTSMENPNEEDRQVYPPVKKVYLISKSVLYKGKVHLSTLGISGYQFGRKISGQEFNEIQKSAGGVEEFCS